MRDLHTRMNVQGSVSFVEARHMCPTSVQGPDVSDKEEGIRSVPSPQPKAAIKSKLHEHGTLKETSSTTIFQA
eukprot:12760116-Prorocentrum_lima.AAC.1